MSKLASDGPPESQHGEQSPDREGGTQPEAISQGEQPVASIPEEHRDPAPWLEPQVQSLAIFTELFRAGDKSQAELEQLLTRYTTSMAWTDFWAREGYITEVVRGSERRYTLSGKAALVLELPEA